MLPKDHLVHQVKSKQNKNFHYFFDDSFLKLLNGMESSRRSFCSLLMAFTLEFHSVWVVKANQLISLSNNNQWNWLILSNSSSTLLSFTSSLCTGIHGFIKIEKVMFNSRSSLKAWLMQMINLWPKLFCHIHCKHLNHTYLCNKVNAISSISYLQLWTDPTSSVRCRSIDP